MVLTLMRLCFPWTVPSSLSPSFFSFFFLFLDVVPDIQLNVKGLKNLKESFDNYVLVETLEGDNKYYAEGHGLQEAKKGVIFKKFPPVLHLQLKRYEYDMMKDAMVKINDRHEFPDSIDLHEYLENPEEQGVRDFLFHFLYSRLTPLLPCISLRSTTFMAF